MKKLLLALAVVVIVAVLWIGHEWTKPTILAKIEFDRTNLYVTNGNTQAWPAPTILLNDAFGGPHVKATDIAPGERRAIPLRSFVGMINKQTFNPEFEKVTKVIIKADGFQLGSYH